MRRLEEFDPLTVPTVTDLLDEINQWDQQQGKEMSDDERAKVPDWQKTSLKSYIEYFRGHIAAMLKDEAKGKRARDEVGVDGTDF